MKKIIKNSLVEFAMAIRGLTKDNLEYAAYDEEGFSVLDQLTMSGNKCPYIVKYYLDAMADAYIDEVAEMNPHVLDSDENMEKCREMFYKHFMESVEKWR